MSNPFRPQGLVSIQQARRQIFEAMKRIPEALQSVLFDGQSAPDCWEQYGLSVRRTGPSAWEVSTSSGGTVCEDPSEVLAIVWPQLPASVTGSGHA